MTKHYKYQLKKLSELKEYDANSRTHSPEQIEQLQRSIKEFGFTSPVLFDENNILVAGHARCIAAANLGMNEVPAIFVDGLTAEQRSALVIADNKLALNAGWNFDALKSEMGFLNDAGYDLDLTGFDETEIESFIGEPDAFDNDFSNNGVIIQYNIIFDDEGQQNAWFAMVKDLKSQYTGTETLGEAIKLYAEDKGLL